MVAKKADMGYNGPNSPEKEPIIMKKELLYAIGAALLAGLILLLILLPANDTPPGTTGPSLSNPTTGAPTGTVTTAGTWPTTKPYVPPTTAIVVTPTGTSIITPPPPETTLPPEPGVVRLYSCDPALQAVYVDLAAEYYAETGTEVIVLSPGEGSCEETLSAMLASDQAPTLFCVHSREMFDVLQGKLQDLAGTPAASALYGEAFAYTADGKLLGLAANVTGSGLIYNAASLAKAGFSASDIKDFAYLSNTVHYITANRGSLNMYAFTAPDFTDSHLMEHLAGLYRESDHLRSFVDLYFANTTSKTTTLHYFLNGTSVFYIGGTGDYDKVSSIGSNNLGFLPAYAEDTESVQCFSNHYWAVSGTASQTDIAETVKFLSWLVTVEDGQVPVDRLGMLSPYQGAAYAGNTLEKALREYISTGNAHVSWTVGGDTVDMDAFVAALQAYKADASDENWAAIVAALESKTP